MDPSQAYLQRLRNLLNLEKEADLQSWRQSVQSMDPASRLRHGLRWQPVQVIRSGFALGDRFQVTLQRAIPQHKDSRFKAGSPVTFYTTSEMANRPESAESYISPPKRACRSSSTPPIRRTG
jgi:hypothetical protein